MTAMTLAGGIAAAPLSASAITAGTLTLLVTDCRTGQPIPAGYAYFAPNVAGFGAVAPVDNGVAGPVGLGAYRWVITVASPGYRPVQRAVRGTGTSSPVRTLSLCMHHVKGSPVHLVTRAYSVNIACSPASAS